MPEDSRKKFERHFWPKVDKNQIGTGCWEWTGFLHRLGYGVFGSKGSAMAHRRLWAELYGPLDRSFELDHLCRNRRCVNPAHLEPVTHAENMRRASREELHTLLKPCLRGHDASFRGTAGCRECNKLRARSTRGRGMVATKERTACPKGHPYDSVGGHGERACSICLNAQKKAWYQRNRAKTLRE